MTTTLNERELDQRLAQLESARAWSPRLVSKLEAFLRRSDDPFALYRVNPIAFAMERGLNEAEVIDLFLHAAKLGLFRMEWRLLCPSCGDTVDSFSSLALVHSECFCSLCQVRTRGQLDDLIQVSFSATPAVGQFAFHQPEALSIEDYCFRYRFDAAATLPESGMREVDVLRSLTLAMRHVAAGATEVFELAVSPEVFIAAHDVDNRAGFALQVDGPTSTELQLVEATLEAGGWKTSVEVVRPGRLQLSVTNRRDRRASFVALGVPKTVQQMNLAFPPSLTGNRLINTQTFRTLFRTEVVGPVEGLGVRDLTLVFNTAARVQALAEPDEICMTHEVYSGAEVRSVLSPRALVPEHAVLKGISRPIQVYRLGAA